MSKNKQNQKQDSPNQKSSIVELVAVEEVEEFKLKKLTLEFPFEKDIISLQTLLDNRQTNQEELKKYLQSLLKETRVGNFLCNHKFPDIDKNKLNEHKIYSEQQLIVTIKVIVTIDSKHSLPSEKSNGDKQEQLHEFLNNGHCINIRNITIQEKTNNLTLALVLKGKEAAKIPQTLKQSDLESLLKKSSYFLCASQLKISEIVKKKLNLGKEETIDSNSDNQQVLVRIHFNHSLSLPQAFRNKLDLHDFFTKGNSSNITIEKNPLTKNPSTKRTGLGQAGFIR